MRAEIFVDTNILFYALTDGPDLRHGKARERVRNLWDQPGSGAVSVQVLQELHVNLIRKAALSNASSAERVGHYLAWTVIDNDRSLLRAGFDAQARWGLSFWDSLIIVAAQRSGATRLWTEDLSAGQVFDGVTVENPLIAP